MAIYEHRCTGCGRTITNQYRTVSSPCMVCGSRMRRVFSFSYRPDMPPHFNAAVGNYVTNYQDFKDQLKKKGDAQSERLGLEHSYTPVPGRDMKDPAYAKVEPESLYDTHKAQRALGWTESKKSTFIINDKRVK